MIIMGCGSGIRDTQICCNDGIKIELTPSLDLTASIARFGRIELILHLKTTERKLDLMVSTRMHLQRLYTPELWKMIVLLD